MNNTSNWTGRTHRTMDQAFGPYERSSQQWFVEDHDPINPADWCMYVLAVIVIFACVAGVL